MMEIEINIFEGVENTGDLIATFKVDDIDLSWMLAMPSTTASNPSNLTLDPGVYKIFKVADA